MEPVRFKGVNCYIAEDQDQYLTLPAYKEIGECGAVTSCWKLSWKERIKIVFSGCIFFTVWTFNEPLQPQRPHLNFPLKG